jgi:tRNA nucleotidyltransferase/poly(A) polymerase
MKIFQVGGCVRDQLLGRVPKDHDYVVVGATPEQMLALGFEKVGASFPVFLKNGEEYALARTERKTAAGYHGFEVVYDPNVTIEDDLMRRDLTINAMAIDPDTGALIDPYGGQHDLAQGILRHVSDAFAEDPIRVLRTARFAARYGFKVATDTLELMTRVVPELETVPKERIWAEFEKGLMEDRPVEMFNVLFNCLALASPVLHPYAVGDWESLIHVTPEHSLEVRFAAIARKFKPEDFDTYRIPVHLAKTARAFTENTFNLFRYYVLDNAQRLDVLTRFRAPTDDKMLWDCVDALALLAPGDHVIINRSAAAIRRDLVAIRSVDNAAIASAGGDIAHNIKVARLDAMDRWLSGRAPV